MTNGRFGLIIEPLEAGLWPEKVHGSPFVHFFGTKLAVVHSRERISSYEQDTGSYK